MANMSFMLTTKQMYNKTKTVTRINGWKNVRPGDKLWAIEKGQGLKKGEKVKRICMIEVTHVRFESLNSILQSDCALEGFPDMDRMDFIDMFIKSHKGVSHFTQITRIEFKFVEITKLHKDLIRHTKKLGYFSTDRKSSDGVAFDELVEMGYAELRKPPAWMGGDATYVLTSKSRNI